MRKRRKEVVPISLELNQERRTLLISGPNTGGKTVSLKTIGLLTLMAQSAIPVPAAEAEFPIFSQVLADIGDYQSIQENLSTFSAHVSHIREMALDVTPDSLVLLDELGSATDPEEGGALGVAIVEHFRAAGAFTLISTHLMALKIYGASPKAWSTGRWASTRRPSSLPTSCGSAAGQSRPAWKSPPAWACRKTSCCAPAAR
jgi:DNA mismatch repair protein MutS2